MRFAALFVPILMAATLPAAGLDLAKLTAGTKLHGFRTEAIYLDGADKPFGARFVHESTGFTFDALQIETAPQGFIWVNSFATSDKGEPHTQEHLLLGKGNVGRAVASLESMTLTGSSAFTMQWRTCYHFNTSAGPDVYNILLQRQLDALLHPDYSDEEIRREVCNFGVTSDPKSGLLRLEEKGTVYNEMVSSTDRPIRRLYSAVRDMAWGEEHPLSFNSGGEPSAIRAMTPQDIRTFHTQTHRLGGMGLIGAYPTSMPLDHVLQHTGAILESLKADDNHSQAAVKTESDLPAPKSAAAGAIRIIDYPLQNESQPSPAGIVWPASRKLDATDTLLFELFLDNVAGDPTTNLYKRLIDSRTRVLDTGARSVFAWTFGDQGQPFAIALNDVATSHLTEDGLKEIRTEVVAELETIAGWGDGSSELEEFQKRMRSRVVERRRDLSKLVNSPPGFGFRGTSSNWMEHMLALEQTGETRRSVTMKPQLAAIEAMLSNGKNIWREKLRAWRVLGVEPYAIGAKPSASLVERDAREREDRVTAEVARLKTKYSTADDQEAIRKYRVEYDTNTVELDRIAKQVSPPKFLEKPPLTLDEQLKWTVSTRKDGVSLFSSTFETMSSATTSLALRLDGVPEKDLGLLSILPVLLTDVGVIIDGKPLSYEEMRERMRNEILDLRASFSTDFRTGRAELLVSGSGNDARESKRAVEWMRLVLGSPDWRPENLSRIRDVVDQQVASLRNRSQGSEESWVNQPAEAYRRQDSILLLTTANFLTRAHNAHRLRWLLRDAGDDASRAAIDAFLVSLGAVSDGASRDALESLAKTLVAGDGSKVSEPFAAIGVSFQALPEPARLNAIEVAKDLERVIADLPDQSLTADWQYLTGQMRADLLVAPAAALGRLDTLRASLLRSGAARMILVSSTTNRSALQTPIDRLATLLTKGKVAPVSYSKQMLIRDRLVAREPSAKDPFFVGLVTPHLKGGVFLISVRGWSYADRDREQLLDYLASRLYAGGGAHGIFMKTWGAGLAYSNGFRGGLSTGTFGYYAERTPELPQTLRFVIGTVGSATPDPELVEYAIAGAFTGSRGASSYESRAMSMADDLVDGWTPQVVSDFRKSVLEIRTTPKLSDELFGRMNKVYARVLPGLGGSVKNTTDPSYFVIGNEKQLAVWEEYLKTVEGPDTHVWRLYPRDFWME